MAKIRLTKNELKKQKDNLKRFIRYLPTLELKKKQLLHEIHNIRNEIYKLEEESQRLEKEISLWGDVFAEEVDLQKWIKIQEIKTGYDNVAGIDIPILEDLIFKEIAVNYFVTPLWIDRGIDVCKEQIARKVKLEIAEKQLAILKEELRITIQRIKLFEEVKIPEAKENIHVIGIFLGDLQTAEVVRGKIAKTKIEKKRVEGRLA